MTFNKSINIKTKVYGRRRKGKTPTVNSVKFVGSLNKRPSRVPVDYCILKSFYLWVRDPSCELMFSYNKFLST